MINQEAFERIADYIESHPEEYDQNVWTGRKVNTHSCGTKMCIAGTAIHLMQPELLSEDIGFWASWVTINNEAYISWTFNDPDIPYIVGGRILGLDTPTAKILFDICWEPAEGLTVPDALRKLGAGNHISEVTNNEIYKILSM